MCRIAGVQHSYHLTNVKTICLKGPLAHFFYVYFKLENVGDVHLPSFKKQRDAGCAEVSLHHFACAENSLTWFFFCEMKMIFNTN